MRILAEEEVEKEELQRLREEMQLAGQVGKEALPEPTPVSFDVRQRDVYLMACTWRNCAAQWLH